MIKHRSVSTLQAKLESVDAAIASHPISSENVQSAHAIIEAIGKDNKELVERTRGTRPARTRRTWENAAARDRELVEAPVVKKIEKLTKKSKPGQHALASLVARVSPVAYSFTNFRGYRLSSSSSGPHAPKGR